MFLLFSSIPLYADWICQETASLKEGKNVLACGIGEGETEALARENAFNNAKKEFHQLCNEDVNCKGYKTTVEPLRNSCEKIPTGYKCYRGLSYSITSIKASETELQNIQDELAKKQKEYEQAKKLYEKKKELDELNKKIADKDFKGPSDWNNFFLVGIQLGLAAIYANDFSLSDLTSSFFTQYIPKKRWGIQLKSHNFEVNDNEPTPDDNIYTYSSNTPLSYQTDGKINTLSLVYYLRDLTLNSPSAGFIAFGKGNADFNYTYTFRNSSFQNEMESSKASTSVTFISLGMSSSGIFRKSGDLGISFGIDFYSFDQSSPHRLNSLMDLYFSLALGF